MMFTSAIAAVLITSLLALTRALLGPTPFDRILAANSMGTCTILLIALSGFLFGRPDWLDIAIIYALVNFAGTIAVLKFVRFKDLAHGVEELDA
jgi:multicomponent Na+:H+ antiporter subunit F